MSLNFAKSAHSHPAESKDPYFSQRSPQAFVAKARLFTISGFRAQLWMSWNRYEMEVTRLPRFRDDLPLSSSCFVSRHRLGDAVSRSVSTPLLRGAIAAATGALLAVGFHPLHFRATIYGVSLLTDTTGGSTLCILEQVFRPSVEEATTIIKRGDSKLR